jgi:nucleotide-binding universal stress UspA family protein
MFSRIMVPVDLAHRNKLGKALKCAAELGRTWDIPVIYTGVTTNVPSGVAHRPAEYTEKLAAFAAEQATAEGIETGYHTVVSHDPAVDLDPALIRAADEMEADLIVMASHLPNVTDYIWPSNGGTVASHAKVTVMVVRD